MASSDMGAIVGGCVAGGAVLLVILSVIIYLLCGKRKDRKRRDQRKFRPLSPGVSPAHSQPSSLSHTVVPEGRLPKVNSTGLWIGAPSLYSGAPSQAYFLGRPPGKPQRDDRPVHIPRAASETRIPQPRGWYGGWPGNERPPPPRRTQSLTKDNMFYTTRSWYDDASTLSWVPLHPGAQRFYHSQQLAPVFEVPPTSGMDIYDVYQFAGGYSNGAPRSKLLETKHTPYYYDKNISNHNPNLTGGFRLGSSTRLERSASDAQERSRSSPKRDHRRQPSRQQSNASSSENRARDSEEARRQRASKSLESMRENGAAVPVIPVSAGGSRASSKTRGDSQRPPSSQSHSSGGAHVNPGYTTLEAQHGYVKSKPAPVPISSTNQDVKEGSSIPNGNTSVNLSGVHPEGRSSTKSSARSNNTTTPSLSPSATDSMKLLSKNKTDDQKTTSPVASIMVENKDDDLGKPTNFQRYQYGGELYTMPSKDFIVSDKGDEDYDNPIVNRLKRMVIEKVSSNPSSPRTELINTSNSSSFGNGVYEEITKVTKVTRSEIVESVEPDNRADPKRGAGGQDTVDLLDGLVLPDILEADNKKKNEPTSPKSPTSVPAVERPPSAKPAALSSPSPAKEPFSPVVTSSPGESGVPSPTSPVALRSKDALSPRASESDDINKAGKRITASAFEFLNNYLSDDDGTEASHLDSPPLSPTGIKPVGDLVY